MLSFLGLLVLLLILVVLLRIVRSAESGALTSRIGLGPSLMSMLTSFGAPSRIVVNGRTYASIDEMPPEVRQEYEQAMNLAISATSRDGVLEFPRRARALRASAGGSTHPDPASRLKQLQEMKDSGLITSDEYEAKRTQILDAL